MTDARFTLGHDSYLVATVTSWIAVAAKMARRSNPRAITVAGRTGAGYDPADIFTAAPVCRWSDDAAEDRSSTMASRP